MMWLRDRLEGLWSCCCAAVCRSGPVSRAADVVAAGASEPDGGPVSAVPVIEMGLAEFVLRWCLQSVDVPEPVRRLASRSLGWMAEPDDVRDWGVPLTGDGAPLLFGAALWRRGGPGSQPEVVWVVEISCAPQDMEWRGRYIVNGIYDSADLFADCESLGQGRLTCRHR